MNAPLVSVNIPVYNGERFLEKTIQSVIDQTYPNVECVLLIDGTHDNSENIIKGFQSRYPHKKITYAWQKNQGLSRTRNALIQMSSGEYIALLDQDDYWKKDKLEKQMALFARDPEVAFVFSQFSYVDEQDRPTTDTYPHPMFRGMVFEQLFQNYFVPCLTIVFKKNIVERIGYFDPQYKFAEEAAFAMKAALFYKFDFIAEPTALCRLHAQNTSNDTALMAYENYFLKKNMFAFAQQQHVALAHVPAIRREIRKLWLAHIRAQVIKWGKMILKKGARS